MMFLGFRRYRKILAWFVASLLCSALLAIAMPNQQQSATGTTPSNHLAVHSGIKTTAPIQLLPDPPPGC